MGLYFDLSFVVLFVLITHLVCVVFFLLMVMYISHKKMKEKSTLCMMPISLFFLERTAGRVKRNI